MHSDLRRTGDFECSDPMLNQLHRNVVWGLKGNFLDVPTDCPQRDERLGWTGDIAVFAPTAAFLYDVDGFLRDWLVDLAARAARRRRDGAVRRPRRAEVRRRRNGLPRPPSPPRSGATPRCGCRGRCGRRTATASVLEAQYDSMAAHVRRVESLLSPTGLWDTGFQFGDWLDPQAPPDDPIGGEGRQRRGRDGLPATGPRASSPTGRGCSADADDARDVRGPGATAPRDAFHKHYVHDDGTHRERRRHGLLAGDRVRAARRRRARRRPASGSPSWSPRTATTSRPGSPARRTSATR